MLNSQNYIYIFLLLKRSVSISPFLTHPSKLGIDQVKQAQQSPPYTQKQGIQAVPRGQDMLVSSLQSPPGNSYRNK